MRALHKPQRARRGQDEAERVGPYHALALAALVLPKARNGIAIPNGDFHRPPLPILGENGSKLSVRSVVKNASREERFAPSGRAGPSGAAHHYHADQASGQHRMPQTVPGLDQSPCFAGMRLPAVPFVGERFR